MCHYDGHANTEKIFKGGWFAFISHEEMLSKMVEMTCYWTSVDRTSSGSIKYLLKWLILKNLCWLKTYFRSLLRKYKLKEKRYLSNNKLFFICTRIWKSNSPKLRQNPNHLGDQSEFSFSSSVSFLYNKCWYIFHYRNIHVSLSLLSGLEVRTTLYVALFLMCPEDSLQNLSYSRWKN